MAIATPAFAPQLGRATTRPPTFHEAAMAHARRPRMPSPDVRFALVREPTNRFAKPVAYPTIRDLARAIHVDRGSAPIQCKGEVVLNIADWGEVAGVAIWTLGETGEQERYIGWAWLEGLGVPALEAALAALQSTAPTIGLQRQGRAA